MRAANDGHKFWQRVQRVSKDRAFVRLARDLEKEIEPSMRRAVKGLNCPGSKPSDWPALAAIAVLKNRPQREMWESVWAKDTGKTWKAITEFPRRLRVVADEM